MNAASSPAPPLLSRGRPSWAVAAPLVALGLALLSIAAWLKERPEFWLNSGGYPVWCREAVLVLFYPWLIGCLAALLVWQGLAILRPSRSTATLVARFALTALFWGVFFAVLYIVAANNLLNLLQGRPLHHH